MNDMKKIVITGPTGAIGIAIIEHMIRNNIEVLAICNPTSKRIERIPKNSLVKIVKCDLDNLDKLYSYDLGTYDVFYHLGWQGTTGEARNDVFLQNENVKNSLKAVELAKVLGCHTFIGAGSQAEYGCVDTDLTPNTPTHPESGYGIAKLCAGEMTRLQCKNIGIKHIWFRVLSVYGPYDGENSLVMSMIKTLFDEKAPNTSKGEQIWDYLYSADAGKAFYLAGLHGKDGAIYCLGSGKAQPLKVYIDTIQKIVNSNIHVNFGAIPYAKNQVMYLCADISNLQKDLGFFPEVNFDEGINKTIQWYEGMQ